MSEVTPLDTAPLDKAALQDGQDDDGTGAVPHSVFSTYGMDSAAAVDAWRENIEVMFDIKPRHRSKGHFFGQVEAFLFGDTVLASCQMAAQNFDRSQFRAGRDGLDHYLLQFYTGGSCGRRDGSADEQTRAGDLWVIDLTQSQATAIDDVQSLNLIVPRRMLAPLLRHESDHHMRVVRKDNPLVGLLHNHVRGLFSAAPHLNAAQAADVLRPTMELAAATLNGAVQDDTRAGVHLSLFETVARYVRGQLTDPDLGPETVAARFGISVRKLSYLFVAQGGFMTYVQRQRLYACRQILTDPAQRHRSIADIAESLCCGHPKSFSRAFRREIGMTAREVRQLALEGDGIYQEYAYGTAWSNWIAQIR